MIFKLGDYVTIKESTHGGFNRLNGAIFKIVALENDDDRAIIMATDRTVLNEEQREYLQRNFYYSMINIYDLENDWKFDDDDFEIPTTLEDWLDEDDENYEEDYTENVEYETLNLGCIVSQSIITKVMKKGNSHLF